MSTVANRAERSMRGGWRWQGGWRGAGAVLEASPNGEHSLNREVVELTTTLNTVGPGQKTIVFAPTHSVAGVLKTATALKADAVPHN